MIPIVVPDFTPEPESTQNEGQDGSKLTITAEIVPGSGNTYTVPYDMAELIYNQNDKTAELRVYTDRGIYVD